MLEKRVSKKGLTYHRSVLNIMSKLPDGSLYFFM